MLGVIGGGASIPVGLNLLWDPMSSTAAIVAPWAGLALGMVAWLVVTKVRSGSISVATTGEVTNAVAGNITSCCGGVITAFITSWLFPGKWGTAEAERSEQAKIRLHKILYGIKVKGSSDGHGVMDNGQTTSSDIDKAKQKAHLPTNNDVEKQPPSDPTPETILLIGNAVVDFLEASYSKSLDPETARKATKLAYGFNIAYWTIALILVPFTFFGTEWEFSKPGFTGWCVVSFIWVWFSAFVCIFWPLCESRGTMMSIVKGVFKDVGGRGRAS